MIKPGYKTTEFWLTAATVLSGPVLTFTHQANTGWAIAASTVLTALYALLRFAAKSNAKPKP